MPPNSNNGSDWFKWFIATLIAILAAGGGIVALLTYFNPKPDPFPRSKDSVKKEVTKQDFKPKKPELRLTIKTTVDMCNLVSFLEQNDHIEIYLKVVFIWKSDGGVTDVSTYGEDINSIRIDKHCGGPTEEGKGDAYYFGVEDKGTYFYGRAENGGNILEGNFIPTGVRSTGQGFYQIAMTPSI